MPKNLNEHKNNVDQFKKDRQFNNQLKLLVTEMRLLRAEIHKLLLKTK